MGLLDSILGGMGGPATTSPNGIFDEIVSLINQHGGVNAFAQSLQDKGLGEAVSSWIGTGANLPVSADQLQRALGSEPVRAIAQRLGISTEAASGGLAQMLPHVIDHLTPNGQIPAGGVLDEGLALLKGKFFGA